MKLHELRAVPGAKKAPKRKGRGTATGQGKTAGRGMNGQNFYEYLENRILYFECR